MASIGDGGGTDHSLGFSFELPDDHVQASKKEKKADKKLTKTIKEAYQRGRMFLTLDAKTADGGEKKVSVKVSRLGKASLFSKSNRVYKPRVGSEGIIKRIKTKLNRPWKHLSSAKIETTGLEEKDLAFMVKLEKAAKVAHILSAVSGDSKSDRYLDVNDADRIDELAKLHDQWNLGRGTSENEESTIDQDRLDNVKLHVQLHVTKMKAAEIVFKELGNYTSAISMGDSSQKELSLEKKSLTDILELASTAKTILDDLKSKYGTNDTRVQKFETTLELYKNTVAESLTNGMLYRSLTLDEASALLPELNKLYDSSIPSSIISKIANMADSASSDIKSLIVNLSNFDSIEGISGTDAIANILKGKLSERLDAIKEEDGNLEALGAVLNETTTVTHPATKSFILSEVSKRMISILNKDSSSIPTDRAISLLNDFQGIQIDTLDASFSGLSEAHTKTTALVSKGIESELRETPTVQTAIASIEKCYDIADSSIRDSMIAKGIEVITSILARNPSAEDLVAVDQLTATRPELKERINTPELSIARGFTELGNKAEPRFNIQLVLDTLHLLSKVKVPEGRDDRFVEGYKKNLESILNVHHTLPKPTGVVGFFKRTAASIANKKATNEGIDEAFLALSEIEKNMPRGRASSAAMHEIRELLHLAKAGTKETKTELSRRDRLLNNADVAKSFKSLFGNEAMGELLKETRSYDRDSILTNLFEGKSDGDLKEMKNLDKKLSTALDNIGSELDSISRQLSSSSRLSGPARRSLKTFQSDLQSKLRVLTEIRASTTSQISAIDVESGDGGRSRAYLMKHVETSLGTLNDLLRTENPNPKVVKATLQNLQLAKLALERSVSGLGTSSPYLNTLSGRMSLGDAKDAAFATSANAKYPEVLQAESEALIYLSNSSTSNMESIIKKKLLEDPSFEGLDANLSLDRLLLINPSRASEIIDSVKIDLESDIGSWNRRISDYQSEIADISFKIKIVKSQLGDVTLDTTKRENLELRLRDLSTKETRLLGHLKGFTDHANSALIKTSGKGSPINQIQKKARNLANTSPADCRKLEGILSLQTEPTIKEIAKYTDAQISGLKRLAKSGDIRAAKALQAIVSKFTSKYREIHENLDGLSKVTQYNAPDYISSQKEQLNAQLKRLSSLVLDDSSLSLADIPRDLEEANEQTLTDARSIRSANTEMVSAREDLATSMQAIKGHIGQNDLSDTETMKQFATQIHRDILNGDQEALDTLKSQGKGLYEALLKLSSLKKDPRFPKGSAGRKQIQKQIKTTHALLKILQKQLLGDSGTTTDLFNIIGKNTNFQASVLRRNQNIKLIINLEIDQAREYLGADATGVQDDLILSRFVGLAYTKILENGDAKSKDALIKFTSDLLKSRDALLRDLGKAEKKGDKLSMQIVENNIKKIDAVLGKLTGQLFGAEKPLPITFSKIIPALEGLANASASSIKSRDDLNALLPSNIEHTEEARDIFPKASKEVYAGNKKVLEKSKSLISDLLKTQSDLNELIKSGNFPAGTPARQLIDEKLRSVNINVAIATNEFVGTRGRQEDLKKLVSSDSTTLQHKIFGVQKARHQALSSEIATAKAYLGEDAGGIPDSEILGIFISIAQQKLSEGEERATSSLIAFTEGTIKSRSKLKDKLAALERSDPRADALSINILRKQVQNLEGLLNKFAMPLYGKVELEEESIPKLILALNRLSVASVASKKAKRTLERILDPIIQAHPSLSGPNDSLSAYLSTKMTLAVSGDKSEYQPIKQTYSSLVELKKELEALKDSAKTPREKEYFGELLKTTNQNIHQISIHIEIKKTLLTNAKKAQIASGRSLKVKEDLDRAKIERGVIKARTYKWSGVFEKAADGIHSLDLKGTIKKLAKELSAHQTSAATIQQYTQQNFFDIDATDNKVLDSHIAALADCLA